jgi:hypothetical protein
MWIESMKRVYIKPESYCLEEDGFSLLTVSNNEIIDPNGNNKGNISNGGDGGSGNFSREGSLFEDDDYDF